MITPGDIDNRKPLEYKAFIDFIYGKLFGDKGYIGKNFFQRLFVDGIQLITKLKSNMKGALMSVSDRLLLRKRAIIETVNDELKNIAQVEHSRHRCFDNFIVNLLGAIAAYCLFPKVVSYNRIVELERDVAVPLTLFIKKVLLGKCTGISFVDSTPLRVCKNQRIHIHKVFKGIAQRGKCSMGWFFGFKLHLICNEKGELLNFMITPGDIDDRKPLEYKAFIDFIYGKLFGDQT